MNKDPSNYSIEEEAAASAVASLSRSFLDCRKRPAAATTNIESNSQSSSNKRARRDNNQAVDPVPYTPHAEFLEPHSSSCQSPTTSNALLPAPFFFYRDHSTDVDEDPFTPLTPPGRVPNFTAKMHAILSTPDLSDVVTWLSHGRSWRVLKPREFEIRVIPTYFEHSKFSSFIRQANGWGFRRITQGRDRNSYYHELFLRGLPHLCKKMRRPGVSEKPQADPDHEPDFYKISELCPLQDKSLDDESILLDCTLQGGPKARMPVHFGALNPQALPPPLQSNGTPATTETAKKTTDPTERTAQDNQIMGQFKKSRLEEPPKQDSEQQELPQPQSPSVQVTHGHHLNTTKNDPATTVQQRPLSLPQMTSTSAAAAAAALPHLSIAQRLSLGTAPANSTPLSSHEMLVRAGVFHQDALSSSSVASHLSAAASHLRTALSQAFALQNVTPSGNAADLDPIASILMHYGGGGGGTPR